MSVPRLLVSAANQILSQLLDHRGGLLGLDWVFVKGHHYSLGRLHAVDTHLAELGANHLVCAGKVDVAGAAQRQTAYCQQVLAIETGHQLGQLIL